MKEEEEEIEEGEVGSSEGIKDCIAISPNKLSR